MKKSTLVAIIALLAAAVGALVTVAVFLDRRAKKLDEYEALLFSEEFNDEFDPEATDELASLEPDAEPASEEAPADPEPTSEA